MELNGKASAKCQMSPRISLDSQETTGWFHFIIPNAVFIIILSVFTLQNGTSQSKLMENHMKK